MTTDPREAAWFAVHDALPAYLAERPDTFDPGAVRFERHGPLAESRSVRARVLSAV